MAEIPRTSTDGRAALAEVSVENKQESIPVKSSKLAHESYVPIQAGAQAEPLGRLIERIVDVKLSEKQKSELLVYVFRLLGSRIAGASSELDEFQLVEKIKKSLANSGLDGSKKAIKFSELYRRFSQKRVISNRSAILLLLYSLGNSKEAKDLISIPLLSAIRHGEEKTGAGIVDPAADLNITLSRIGLSNQQTHQQTRRTGQSLHPNTSFELPEVVLVKDVIYAMQGIEGKYVRFDKQLDGYNVDRSFGVPATTRDLIRRICESGWLYRKISAFNAHWSSSKNIGLVGQGLITGLQAELTDYFKLVAVLQSHIAEDQISTSNEPFGNDDNFQQPNQSLTLRRLLVWVQEPIARLRVMALLCDAAMGLGQNSRSLLESSGSSTSSAGGAASAPGSFLSPLKGGQLASAISVHARHGDPAVQQLLKRILKPVCRPILQQIRKWISDGEVEDPWNEFFIENDYTKLEHHWEDKYKLRPDMIPSFVSEQMAFKILQIGKSINFIRKCCRDIEYVSEASNALERMKDIEYGQWEELEEVVGTHAGLANQALLSGLFHQYRLRDHLQAIKRYLLFGQGDFVRYLIDLLADNVRPGASTVHHHNLTGIVETAIRASSSQTDDGDVRERVHVSTMEATGGDDLFSVFSLEYKLDTPCNAVIGEKSMRKYKRVFNFLWGLKRVEQALSTSWRRASELCHIGTHNVTVRGADREAHRELQKFALAVVYKASNMWIHHQMMHFITNLQYYMMFEVLECSWEELNKELQAIQDVDQLIASHNRYVEKILERALLTEDSETEKKQMDRVFKCILDYCFTQQQICDFAERKLERHGLMLGPVDARDADHDWREHEEAGEDDEAVMRIPTTLTCKIESKAVEFSESFSLLRDMLSSTKSADLRSLNFRLDFSEFYADMTVPQD